MSSLFLRKGAFVFLLLGLSWAQELDYPFVVDRPRLSVLGDAVSFSCRLSLAPLTDENCRWYTPDGRTLVSNVNDDTVLDDASGVQASGYSAAGDESTCGMEIAALSEADVGQWSCLLDGEVPDGVQFHMGTFQILTDGFLGDIRLPRHLVPIDYDVELVSYIAEDNFTTDGRMELRLEFNDSVEDPSRHNKIYMHSKEIAIDEAGVTVTNVLDNEVAVAGHEYDVEREFYVIHLADNLVQNVFIYEYTVSMSFVARLNDLMAGFYRSSYVEDGRTSWLGVSQFWATDARRSFPCLDEPDLKATFVVHLGHHDSMVARSNMPAASSVAMENPDGYVMTTFDESLVMSTYLVAFLVADFGSTAGVDDDTFNIWHMKSKAGQGDLAADAGPKILDYFVDYFDVAYPLPKTDMVAVPDFDFGAMENWGLITYRETSLLYDPALASRADRDRVIEVVAHELSHMWFGNLVTMEWWTDLWLNEGFATYVENKGKDFYDPDLQSVDRTVIVDLQDVFQIDGFESTVAISSEVTNPDYDMVFSRISYGKGNCLIRMIEHFMTLETFNKGLTAYLNEYAYGNADRNDLWNSLNEAALEDGILEEGLDVADIMENWTVLGGYPVVTVVADNNDSLTLSQRRFFFNPDAPASTDKWSIPVSVAYPAASSNDGFDDTLPSAWILNSQDEIFFEVASSRPYVLNVQQTGYFRVNYLENNWIALNDILVNDRNSIDRLNRAQIYDDSLNLARAQMLDYGTALDLSAALVSERDYIPLEAGLRALDYINLMFRETDDLGTFSTYMRAILSENYDELGFDIPNGEGYLDVLRRASVIAAVCLHQRRDCVEEAREQFRAWMDSDDPVGSNPIDPDLKLAVYRVAVREGGQEEFDFLLDLLPQFTLAQDIQKAIYGLASSTDADNLKYLLGQTILEDSLIRSQDAIYVYAGIGDTAVGRRVQFDWLRDEYESVKAFYGTRLPSAVEDIVAGFTETGNTQDDIDEMQAFLDEHLADLGSAVTSIEQGIDRMRVNLNWMENNFDAVRVWLEEETDGQETTWNPNETTTTVTSTTTTTMTTTTTTRTTTMTTTTTSTATTTEDIVGGVGVGGGGGAASSVVASAPLLLTAFAAMGSRLWII